MTPSPRPQRKRRGGNKPSTQRAQASAPAVMAVDGEVVDRESGNSGEDYAQEDEDALFDLLGVVSPPKSVELHAQLESRPGLIVLPKGEGPNAVKKSRKARKSKKTAGQGSDLFVKDDDGLQQHGGVPVDPAPKEKSKKLTKLPLTAMASAPPGPVQTTGPTPTLDQLLASAIPAAPSPKPRAKRVQRAQDDSTFEMSSLSQNLPSDLEGAGNGQQKKGKSKKKENASAVWDMPDAAGGDELTVSIFSLIIIPLLTFVTSGSKNWLRRRLPPVLVVNRSSLSVLSVKGNPSCPLYTIPIGLPTTAAL